MAVIPIQPQLAVALTKKELALMQQSAYRIPNKKWCMITRHHVTSLWHHCSIQSKLHHLVSVDGYWPQVALHVSFFQKHNGVVRIASSS